jgi:hypothetical protein
MPEIKEGFYPAFVKSLKDMKITVNGETREVVEWTYLVHDGEKIQTVTGLTGNKITPRTKFGKYISTIFGEYPEDDFDDELLLGTACQVYVTIEERKTSRGSFVNAKVTDVQSIMPQKGREYAELESAYLDEDPPF